MTPPSGIRAESCAEARPLPRAASGHWVRAKGPHCPSVVQDNYLGMVLVPLKPMLGGPEAKIAGAFELKDPAGLPCPALPFRPPPPRSTTDTTD